MAVDLGMEWALYVPKGLKAAKRRRLSPTVADAVARTIIEPDGRSRLDCTRVAQTRDGVTRTHIWACRLRPDELAIVHSMDAADCGVRPEAYRPGWSESRVLLLEMG